MKKNRNADEGFVPRTASATEYTGAEPLPAKGEAEELVFRDLGPGYGPEQAKRKRKRR